MVGRSYSSLREFYDKVYAPLRLRGKSDSTKRQYVLQLELFERFLGHVPSFADLTDEVVCAFLGSIVDRGNSPATANKARNHILALWRLAADRHYVDHKPEVPAEREPTRIPQAWTAEDLVKLFDACEKVRGTIAGVPASLWWHALHTVLWWTGERIGAVLQLRWEYIDMKTGWLTIPAELRKGKTGDRIFELPEDAINDLNRIGFPKRELIFPWDRHHETLWIHYRRLLQRGGLAFDRKSKFHRMRRSAASHFEAAGGNATNLMDHSHRKTTLAYLDPRIVKPEQTKDRLFIPHNHGANRNKSVDLKPNS